MVCNAAELTIDEARRGRGGRTLRATATVDPDDEPRRLCRRERAGLRPGRAALPVLGDLQRQAARLLPRDLHRRRRGDRARRSPPRRWRRPTPGVPFPASTSPTARRCSRSPSRSPDGLAAFSNGPVVAEEPLAPGGRRRVRFATTIGHVDLSRGLRRRAARGDRAAWTSTGCPVRVVHVPGKGHLTALRARGRRPRAAVLHRLLRHRPTRPRSSTSSPSPTSPSAPWRTWAASPSARAALLVDPAPGGARRARARRRRRLPRDRPHVVRRPRHHALVERHLAQRGLRHLHGGAVRRRLPTRVAALGQLRARARSGAWRSTACTRPGRSSTRWGARRRPRGCSTSSPTRRAAAVLRMLEHYLGPEVFRDGVRGYLRTPRLRQHRDRRPVGRHRDASSGEPVREIMDTWIFQGGFPLVAVADDGADPQSPFAYRSAPPGADSAIRGPWQVPVIVRHSRAETGPPSASSLRRAARLTGAATTGWSTPGGWGFYGSPIRASISSARARRSATSSPSSATTSSRTPGRRHSPGSTRSGTSSLASRLADGGERDPSVWSVVSGALGLFDRVGPTPTVRRSRGRPGRSSAPPESALGWEPRRATRASGPRHCEHPCCAPWAPSATARRRSRPRRPSG